VKRLLAGLTITVAALAWAIGYRVDISGGPLTLAEEIQAAFNTWLEPADVGLTAQQDEAADTLIRYGEVPRFGPDTLSLTLQQQGDNDNSVVEVLLNPQSYRDNPATLLHETGLLLGLPAGQSGVMNPALSSESPQAPDEVDRAALAELQSFAPEDLTRDGVVDFYDLAALAKSFGRQGVNLPADLDSSGTVDAQDIEVLKASYTFTPPSPTPPEPPAPASTGDGTPGDTPPTDAPSQEPLPNPSNGGSEPPTTSN